MYKNPLLKLALKFSYTVYKVVREQREKKKKKKNQTPKPTTGSTFMLKGNGVKTSHCLFSTGLKC